MPRELRRRPAGEEYWSEAVRLFVETARESVRQRGGFAVAMAGGRTPAPLYERLASLRGSEAPPWSRIRVFFGDERWVGPEDPASNVRLVEETLLGHLPEPPWVYPPRILGLAPAEAAREYAAVLRRELGDPPVFDLVLLGLGTDGHTASLFPHAPELSSEDPVAAPYVPALGTHRLTLTPSCLNRSRLVVFLVVGAAKAEVLRQVYRGPVRPFALPAQLIDPPAGRCIWLVDSDAASRLDD